jgi:ADP-heptose:LPS heptosyltransferase/2-polyprenyl-3-methyl-5-hydroxy-6-metoxy-1,4-benzoquinol methylase
MRQQMWVLQAPPNQGAVTGNMFDVVFTNGFAFVDNQRAVQILLKKGCTVHEPMTGMVSHVTKNLDRVLVLRMVGVGDVLMITPVLKALKAAYPGVKIRFATQGIYKSLLLNNPYVDSVHSGLMTQLGRHEHQFDEVLDFTHSIEWNREAEIKNAYEHTLQIAGLSDPRPMPELFLSKAERNWAKRTINELPGAHTGPKIGIHWDATAPQRSMPSHLGTWILSALVEKGYKLFLFGKDSGYQTAQAVLCPKCGVRAGISMAPNVSSMRIRCGACDHNFPLKKDTHIQDGMVILDRFSLRQQAAIVEQMDLMVCTDSGFMHIAGALEAPMIALFSSFDANLRIKHFKNTLCLQQPYRCAPCHLHGPCPRQAIENLNYAPCMASFNPDKIVSLVTDVIEGKVQVYNDRAQIDGELIVDLGHRACPICDGWGKRFECRKGDYFYWRCPDCATVYTHKIPDMQKLKAAYDDPAYNIVYKNPGLEEGTQAHGNSIVAEASAYLPHVIHSGKKIQALDIGCGRGSLALGLIEGGATARGLDISPRSIADARERTGRPDKFGVTNIDHAHIYSRSEEGFEECEWWREDPYGIVEALEEKRYDLVVLHHTLEHVINPIRVLEKVKKLISLGGVIHVGMPNIDFMAKEDSITEFGHLNTFAPGEHIQLLGRTAMGVLAKKAGLELFKYVELPSGQSMIAWLRVPLS